MSFIYFAAEMPGGPIKIGKTEWPGRRLVTLQCGNPREIRYLRLAFLGKGAKTYERTLHRKLAHYRIRGEWFHPHDEVRREIELLDDVTCWKCGRSSNVGLGISGWDNEARENIFTPTCEPCGGLR